MLKNCSADVTRLCGSVRLPESSSSWQDNDVERLIRHMFMVGQYAEDRGVCLNI